MTSDTALRRVMTSSSPVSTSEMAAGSARRAATPVPAGDARPRRPRDEHDRHGGDEREPSGRGWAALLAHRRAAQDRAEDQRDHDPLDPEREQPAETRWSPPVASPTARAARPTSADWSASSQIERPMDRVATSSTPRTTMAAAQASTISAAAGGRGSCRQPQERRERRRCATTAAVPSRPGSARIRSLARVASRTPSATATTTSLARAARTPTARAAGDARSPCPSAGRPRRTRPTTSMSLISAA